MFQTLQFILLINFGRACVGRNLASMELLIIIASIFHRYEFVVEDPDKPVRYHAVQIHEALPDF